MTPTANNPGPPRQQPPSDTRTRRPRHRVRWAALAVGTVTALIVVVFAVQPSAANRQVESPLLGRLAPPVTGPSVTPYPFGSLASLRGQWVIVNFFATWCIPCQQEQPQLARFAAQHTHRDAVQLTMVIYNDSTPNVRQFLASRSGDWPAIEDPDGQISLSYGVAGIPETYLVDPYGIIVAKIVGGSTTAGLNRLIADAKAKNL